MRAYWSERAKTFDDAFGHGILSPDEFRARQKPIRDTLGAKPLRVLELACGTGEITKLIHDLGHDVTALDFSEAMLDVARAKHAGKPRLRFLLADAENTMEPDECYDAIICRHLVWTLLEPEPTFREWKRLLTPGGKLVVYDGDWSKPTSVGRIAASLVAAIDRFFGADPYYDGSLSERHAEIIRALPFAGGLHYEALAQMLEDAGFVSVSRISHAPIAKAQRRTANLRNRLRTHVYRRFILTASRPMEMQTGSD
ncbi:methyltransferase domain-containing protein [Mesorhizobium sp. M1406]|uniref:class I SAM-dependent methyltransferase n=1 Tax=Mesorhizobium sp. M1406 TaxID=2957099 RepID=UPI0033355C2F